MYLVVIEPKVYTVNYRPSQLSLQQLWPTHARNEKKRSLKYSMDRDNMNDNNNYHNNSNN